MFASDHSVFGKSCQYGFASIFYSLFQQNPCISCPYLNNGICQVGYTAKGFCCKCPAPFTGEHCDEGASDGNYDLFPYPEFSLSRGYDYDHKPYSCHPLEIFPAVVKFADDANETENYLY